MYTEAEKIARTENGRRILDVSKTTSIEGDIMKKDIIAVLVYFMCMAIMAAPLFAQQGFGRMGMGGRGGMNSGEQKKYDPSQTEIVTGEVTAVKYIETKNGKTSGVGLELNTGSQSLLVYLGPHVYVDTQNVRIDVGDKVEVKGVKAMFDGTQAFIAGEVMKNGETLKLRDDTGAPLWGGKGHGHGGN